MKTSEMVLDFLRKQGFCPEVDSDNGNIMFKYQMATFLFVNNNEDEEFFQLIMPFIYDVSEDNREIILEAANKINKDIKVVKACIMGESVWLLFENLLDQSPEVGSIIERALNILHGARQQFYDHLR